jgi:serine/threonine protein kinase
MSQHGHQPDKDLTRTRLGMGRLFLKIAGGATPSGVPADRTPPGARLGERLGGVRGQVYAASHAGHAGQLAAKLFPWGAGLERGVVRAFTREALMVASAHHPHIAHVLDAGLCPDGTPFVLLERLEGRTLEELLAARGVLGLGETIEIVRGITSGLAAAHATGVAHRELRADNVFLVDLAGYAHGFPKLLDFGVSHLTAGARDAGRVVPERAGAGVAPEQRRDGVDHGDPRSDQLALAALAYRMLTGADPQAGGPAFERLWDGGAPPWAGGAREIAAVESVLRRAMSWRPENRFDSVAEFLLALETAAIVRPRLELRAVPSDEPPPRRLRPTPPPAPPPAWVSAVPSDEPPPPRPRTTPPPAAPLIATPAPEPPRPTPPPDASLMQQFFAEGERQDAAHAEAAHVEPAMPDEPAASLALEIPRRRAPALAAVALAVAALAALAGSSLHWLVGHRAAPSASAPR